MTDTLNKTSQSCTVCNTPETDAEHERICEAFCHGSNDYYKMFEFARKLERERDILKKHIKIMDAAHKTTNDEYFKIVVEAEELEVEVKLWKENATSNRDVFDEMSKELDEVKSELAYRLERNTVQQVQLSELRKQLAEAVSSCHIWQQGHSEIVNERDKLLKLVDVLQTDRDGWKRLHIETNGLFPDLTVREQEKDIGLLDRDNLSLRVKWVNALRAIVGATMPKNKSGMSLVSDIDLILALDEQRLAALEKIK